MVTRGLPPSAAGARARRRAERGMTLLEVMMATAIMLVVLAGLATLMLDSVTSQRRQRNTAEAQQNARIVMQVLSRYTARAGAGLILPTEFGGRLPRPMVVHAPFELMAMDHVSKAADAAGLTEGELLFGLFYQGEEAPPPTIYQGATKIGLSAGNFTVPMDVPSGMLNGDANSMPLLIYNPRLARAIFNGVGTWKAKSTKALNLAAVMATFESKAVVGDADVLTIPMDPAPFAPDPASTDASDDTSWHETDIGSVAGELATAVYGGVRHAAFAFNPANGTFYVADFAAVTNGGKSEINGAFRAFGSAMEMVDVAFIFNDGAATWSMTLGDIATNEDAWVQDKEFLKSARFDIISKTRKKVKAPPPGGFGGAQFINREPNSEYADRIVRLTTTVNMLGLR